MTNHSEPVFGETSGSPADTPATDAAGEAPVVSAALYRSLIESLPVCILRKDLDGRLVFANQTACKFFGKPFEQLVGKTDFDLFSDDMARKYREDDRRVVESRAVFEGVEKNQERNDGPVKYVQVLKIPVFDASENVIGTQVLFWDVTTRRQAEERLLDYERYLLHCLLDNSPDSIYFKDADGRYLRISKAKARRSGLADPAEGTGKTDFDFFPREHALRTEADERQVMQTGQSLTGKEERLIWPDGSISWSSTTKVPLKDLAGKIVGTFGISRDITAQKLAEAAARAAQTAAETANRAKSDFLANMSHEIRTPMNAILGMTEMLLDSSINDTQREYLKIVLESGESLLTIVNDILDFSKIEAGKLELDNRSFCLRESVGDIVKSLALRAHRKGLELAYHVSPLVPEQLVGDANRLRQIIVNLLGNAIKFTERGEVVLSVFCESNAAETVELHFAIRDTGIGVPADKLEKIFQAFEQSDVSMTRRYGGTGLGLAIASRLVALKQGRIWVESEVGRGSTFHFTACYQTDRGHAAPEQPVIVGGTRVLIVDDNATNRFILLEMAKSWGMRPQAVATAVDALQVLHAAALSDPFQLLVSDVNMPDVDGFTMVEQIRQQAELRNLKIIMLTSGDRPENLTRCRTLGIERHLLKPIKPSELLEAVIRVLGVTVAEDHAAPTVAAGAVVPPLQILLAEDTVVNQKLVQGLLGKHGHCITIAGNGLEAVSLARSNTYNLILMDVQMPEMDGYEATRAIRDFETPRGRHTPIIALTAHAMKGDRELCLAAGMDEYLSKPIRAQQLFDTIARIVAEFPLAAEPCAAEASSAPMVADSNVAHAVTVEVVEEHDVVDWDYARQSMGDDEDLLREVVQAFLEELPQRLNDIRQAIAAGEARKLQVAAHTLKGSLRYFGQGAASGLALQIETCGRTGLLAEATDLFTKLAAATEVVAASLRRYLAT